MTHAPRYVVRVARTYRIALGYSSIARVLVVVHIAGDDTIRIISARKANRHERAVYEKTDE